MAEPERARTDAAREPVHLSVLECGDTRIEVGCPSRADAAWLEEFVAPAFRVGARGDAADWRVEAILDGELYRELLASRPPGPLPEPVTFVLDQSVLRAAEWRMRDGQRVLADAAHGMVHLVSPGLVRMVGDAPRRPFRLALLRVVRELFMSRAWGESRAILHAGALALGGRALLIAGPKRAGKTSLLIHALGAPGAHYLANDRVVLSGEAGGLCARGLPTYVSVRHGTLALFPELARRLAESGVRAHRLASETDDAPADATERDADDVKVSPPQLARLVGAPLCESGPLGAVLLPQVDLGESGLRLRRLSPHEADARFEDVLFAATSPATVSEVFVTPGEARFDRASARSLWGRAVRSVPVFECRIGRGAFDAPVSGGLLRAVLDASDARAPAPVRAPMDALVSAELARQGLEVVASHRVSPFSPERTNRHAYCIALADGRTLKARRTLSEERARQVSALLGALSDPRIARVLSCHGPVLIEEWIEGEALPEAGLAPGRLREAAALLASLHAVEKLAGTPVHGEAKTEARRAATEAMLARLAERGALGAREAAALAAVLRRSDPGRARTGLVHLDFCLENMVVDRQGALRLVDNESVDLDAFDFDLARAWYRSELSPETWAAFEREYHQHGGPAGREGSTHFWRIAAVAEGAWRRVEKDPARARMPLDRLRELAASLA
jgi:hypothetical protein